MGCSIPVALSTMEKIVKVKRDKNILILGSGALGLPMIHFCKQKKLKTIDVLEQNTIRLLTASSRLASHGPVFERIFGN